MQKTIHESQEPAFLNTSKITPDVESVYAMFLEFVGET